MALLDDECALIMLQLNTGVWRSLEPPGTPDQPERAPRRLVIRGPRRHLSMHREAPSKAVRYDMRRRHLDGEVERRRLILTDHDPDLVAQCVPRSVWLAGGRHGFACDVGRCTRNFPNYVSAFLHMYCDHRPRDARP